MDEVDEDAVSLCIDLSPAEPADVDCDACKGRKRRAEQTCLECVASYCQEHLELHDTLHGGKRHKLVEVTERLQERICSIHGKLLEVFCRTDQQCICHLCITDTHTAHDVVSIEVETEVAHIKLETLKRKNADKIKTREKEMQDLQQTIEAFKASAVNAVDENEKLFTELVQSMEMRKHTVKELISAREEAVIKKANEVLDEIQEEISEMKKRDTELQHLKQLSLDSDIHFLQGVSSLHTLPMTREPVVFFVHPYCSFELATQAVSDLIEHLNQICQSCSTSIAEKVRKAVILASPALKIREDFLQYACKLTLNLNTAHNTLCLSENHRVVTIVKKAEDYVDHPERFERRVHILCNEGLQGNRQYWEVEFCVKWCVCIAVSYMEIQRKEKWGSLFGRNQCSWGLYCYRNKYIYWHNKKSLLVKYEQPCSRIGVYLDHGCGVLAFYNVSDNMTLIHQVQTKFTEAVYAGFGLLGKGTSVKLCDSIKDVLNEKKTLLSYSANELTEAKLKDE